MPHAKQLGRYLLLDRIGAGGMAEIFRAKAFDEQGHAHMVAIKRVLSHLTSDEEFLSMLVDEARISASLKHENIARIYEFVHAGDEYFIAMEYVDGKDGRTLLEDSRARSAPVPAEHVLWIALQTAAALEAAHTQRDRAGRELHIVHRDISPSNVLLAYSGEVKLCDFGIAKANLKRVQTKTGIIKGKVKYMSPEQAMGQKLDARSDLFSLGTLMYELLTLESPFQAETEAELLFLVREAKKRDARAINPAIPAAVSDLLNRMMARARSDRPGSAAELASLLAEHLDRIAPGYRRTHFARYMRTTFAEDIEQELRRLEEYVVEHPDPTFVGENLIADPESTPPLATGHTPSGLDLHYAPTLILARRPRAPITSEATRVLPDAPPSQISQLDTRVLDEVRSGSFHQLKTHLLGERSSPSSFEETSTTKGDGGPGASVDTRAGTLPSGQLLPGIEVEVEEGTATALQMPPTRDTQPSLQAIAAAPPPDPALDEPTPLPAPPGFHVGARLFSESRTAEDDEDTSLPIREEDIEPA